MPTTNNPRTHDSDQPRRRLLGLAVLLLTLGGAYALAQSGVVPPAAGIVAVVQEVEAESAEPEAPRAPTAAEIMAEIDEVAARHHVPARLVAAIVAVESEFNPHAVSRRGAQGLMQLMPETASMLGVRNSFDPQQNIDGGVRHLRGLIDRFGNDLPLALAAYNAGEKAVVNHRGIPPFPETRDYVTRVLHLYDGGTNGSASASSAVYRTVGDDGTIVYTNIPPRGRR